MTLMPPIDDAATRPESSGEGWDVSPRLRRRIMPERGAGLARERAAPDRPLPTSRGVLTPAEIEALLRPDLSDMDEALQSDPVAPPMAEFAPAAASAVGSAPAGETGREDAARRMAARLSRALREHCGLAAAVSVRRIAAQPVCDAVMAREERGQAIICAATPDGDVAAMLVLGAGLTQMLIETACGAPVPVAAPRPLSPIDLALLEGLARPLVPAIGGGLSYSGVETDPQFAGSIAAPGAGYDITLSIRAGGADWPARLLLPAGLLAASPEAGTAALPAPEAGPDSVPVSSGPATGSGALTVLLTARVASVEMPLSRLTRLRPGATLMLGVPADQPVELLSGDQTGQLAAEAEIGRKGSRMALRITRRGPALRALNPSHPG